MTEPTKMPPIEDGDILCQSMQTGKAWVPMSTAGEINEEAQKAKKLMRDLYECMQRLEVLIGGG
jgi:hypothetical protein